MIEGEIVDQEKIAYLVGYSMVKNNDPKKRSKAFKGTVAERKTYSGRAKVKDIHPKA